jgi:hypothetical protein
MPKVQDSAVPIFSGSGEDLLATSQPGDGIMVGGCLRKGERATKW